LPRNACGTGGSTYTGSPERARSWSVRAVGPVAAGIAWLVFAVVVVRAQSVDNRIEASMGRFGTCDDRVARGIEQDAANATRCGTDRQ
jgi:hypothetical protein